MRALEVIEITGAVLPATLPDARVRLRRVVQIGIDVPRDVLDERIAARVDRMWQAGLRRRGAPAGARTACATGGPRAAHSAIAQVLRFLAGACTEDEAREDDRSRDPEVRAPAGHLVQARPADRWLPWTTPTTCWRAALDAVRSERCELSVRQGPRHAERLRRAARPRRHRPRRSRAALVAALCDRRAGIGADGVLRVLRGTLDGGRRVVHGLPQRRRLGLGDVWQRRCGSSRATSPTPGWSIRRSTARSPIDTRDGIKHVTFCDDGEISVDMGTAKVAGDVEGRRRRTRLVAARASTWATLTRSSSSTSLDEAGRAARAPDYDAAEFPTGVNVEFVVVRGRARTSRCGSSSAAWGRPSRAARVRAPRGRGVSRQEGDDLPASYAVEVRRHAHRDRGRRPPSHLKGPAELVADGTWLLSRRARASVAGRQP